MATTIEFPQALSHIKPNIDGFNFIKGATKAPVAFESGEIFHKKLNRKINDRFACGLSFTFEEFEIFKTFYDVTLEGGINSFMWSHPIFQNRIECKFIGEYDLAMDSGVSLTMISSLEIIE